MITKMVACFSCAANEDEARPLHFRDDRDRAQLRRRAKHAAVCKSRPATAGRLPIYQIYQFRHVPLVSF